MPHPIASAILWLVPCLAAACSRTGTPGAAPAAPPPPAVAVEAATGGDFLERTEISGRIVATEMVELRPRISGHLREVRFQPGQIVEKDHVLFQIDPRWQQAAVDRAKADLEAAEVRLGVAEREHERAKQLVAGNAISEEELQARTGRVLEARASLAAAKAAEVGAQLDLEFTQVRAPIRGRVSRPLVTEGNYVSGVAGMTTILTTIVAVDPVHFYADLDETAYLAFQSTWSARTEGTKVPVHLQLGDEKDFPRTGFVESLDNRLDASTGTILLRAEFANEDGRLVPGLYGRAWLSVLPKQTVVFVDERAVGTDQNQKFVFVIGAGEVADYRRVELGPLVNGKRVIRQGVQAGDRVVVQGQQRVRPGNPVQVIKAPVAAVGAASTNAAPAKH